VELSIEPMTVADLLSVRTDHASFWGDRDLRPLHLTALVQEFGETCLTARRPGSAEIAGYLVGFTTPRQVAYIHLVAVRATYRGEGLARALYQAFTGLAQAQGATSAKAITSPANTGSVAFHQRLGFAARQIPGYNGPSQPMIVMTRPLPLTP
jgi:ribosomal protein S18 acetylase RimI-like enzyme